MMHRLITLRLLKSKLWSSVYKVSVILLVIVFTSYQDDANASESVVNQSHQYENTSHQIYPFTSATQAAQFDSLIKQMRCLVCQNENLADSNADLAYDLRQKIYEMIKDGDSDSEIKRYFVDRYGDFILFNPPLTRRTIVLWFFPGLLLLLGFVILYRLVRR